MMGDRCTGDCCRRFPISASLEEIREDLARADRGEKTRFVPAESRFILDMVIPLEVSTIGIDGEEREAKQYYRCRHLLENGDCGSYKTRPLMCRDYPHYGRGGACEHAHCQWEDGKNPPIPTRRLVRLLPIRGEAIA